MKHFLTVAFSAFLFFHAAAQDITGTWNGYLKLNIRYAHDVRRDYAMLDRDSLFMNVELKQQDRKVTVVFYYARKDKQQKPLVVYQASALLDKKKPLDYFKIRRDGVLEDHTKAQIGNYFFRYMEATYQKSDNEEVLYGNWYDEHGNKWVYWVKKANSNIGPHLQQIVDR